ncbi:MAG: sigma-54-dependent Fis family transcriptional regulator [Myxococcales bacterium]|nr:sigma-54-dependent Fis family transcriptional regulator [Myxococcales bacterium]
MAFVKRVGPSDATVLLGGESGAGKEMVARAIRGLSRRAKGPCVAVNCAALTETLIERANCSATRRARSPAPPKKAGRFEMADHGTLFLDEVGELPLNLRPSSSAFSRSGGSNASVARSPSEVDVRMVAATNRDLAEMVQARHVPRGSVLSAERHRDRRPTAARTARRCAAARRSLPRSVPQPGRAPDLGLRPRCARGDDPLQLARKRPRAAQCRRARDRAGRSRADRRRGSPAASAPAGRAAAQRNSPPTPPLGSSSMTTPTPPPMASLPNMTNADHRSGAAAVSRSQPVVAAARSLRELEKDGILAALAATGGNKAQAAVILEIDRSTLYKKLKDYGIES